MRAGGGWLPASHLGKSRSGIGVRTNTLAKYARHDGANTSPVLRFHALRHQFNIQSLPQRDMISVTVELTASEPIAAVNDFQFSARQDVMFQARKMNCCRSEVINRQFDVFTM